MIDKLLIYSGLLMDDIIRDAASYAYSKDESIKYSILRRIYKQNIVSPHAYEEYLEKKLLSAVNRFSLLCEKQGIKTLEDDYLVMTVKNDLDIIKKLFLLAPDFDLSDKGTGPIARFYIDNSTVHIIEELMKSYYQNGCGELYESLAYAWDGGIINIHEPDLVMFDDLVGYDHHKRKIINNTNAFIEGKPYNNILLFGDRGTGKSSCVKAAFNMFKSSRLRIIELSKKNISQIQDVMDFSRKRGFDFILFLDDLSFEDTEYEYKELKAHLEGGLLSQPENVVIYATSNRFHIVRETQKDNTGITDDIHLNDAIQEKLSLSDRFGITITFDTPTPKEYLNIVKKLLERNNKDADEAVLKKLAFRWEIANHGRSGRSAVQFVKSVIGRIDEDVILDEDS